ncbi:MAG TPA: SDR family oxidoreductase [Candidatus Paceibacterota bacterium]|nr:SDR family oxidoreductase [Candidatus Paceibacterota bacterium]
MKILLTGASGGIGSAIRESLEKNGARVLGFDHTNADLSSYEGVKKIDEKVDNERLDWLVCAHGFIDFETDFLKQTPENIKTTFDINTLSLFYLAQMALPRLNPGGGMIFISSTAGLAANGRYSAYSASKAAVNALAQALARNQPDFTFISVCPGPTNTPMRENLAHDAAKQQSPAAVAEVIKNIIEGQGDYKSGDIIVVKNGEVSKAGNI